MRTISTPARVSHATNFIKMIAQTAAISVFNTNPYLHTEDAIANDRLVEYLQIKALIGILYKPENMPDTPLLTREELCSSRRDLDKMLKDIYNGPVKLERVYHTPFSIDGYLEIFSFCRGIAEGKYKWEDFQGYIEATRLAGEWHLIYKVFIDTEGDPLGNAMFYYTVDELLTMLRERLELNDKGIKSTLVVQVGEFHNVDVLNYEQTLGLVMDKNHGLRISFYTTDAPPLHPPQRKYTSVVEVLVRVLSMLPDALSFSVERNKHGPTGTFEYFGMKAFEMELTA